VNLVIGPVAASATADRPDVDISIKTSEIEVEVNPSDMGITIMPPVAREIVGADVYDGEYALTPSQQAQQLQTSGKLLTANITVNPIPQNYGLITWNGAFLTVS